MEDRRDLNLWKNLEDTEKFKLATDDIKENVSYINEIFYRKKEEIVIDDKVDLSDISIDAIKNILPFILKVKYSKEEEING